MPFLFIFFAASWLAWGAYLIAPQAISSFPANKILLSLSLEEKHAYVTGVDYYNFIKFCEKIIPADKSIRGIFVGENVGVTEFYYYRSYYFLYPRNFIKDADYLFLYNLSPDKAPAGYKLIAEFAPGKYVLAREEAGK